MRNVLTSAILAIALSSATSSWAAEVATADMIGADGKSIGKIKLEQTPTGVLLQYDLRGLPAGGHGFHIHAVGACAPNFKAAGGHFNPSGKEHGLRNAKGHHAGDMANLVVGSDETIAGETLNTEVTFKSGKNSLFDNDGSSIIIHAKPDTHGKAPGAGGRIACGVIRK